MAVAPSRPMEASSISKEEFYLGVKDVKKCSEMFHAGVDSCSRAWLNMAVESCKGTTRFFLPMYLIQLAVKRKEIDRAMLKKWFLEFCRSVLFGTCMSTIYVVSSCLLFRLLGRIWYYTGVFLPATFAGLAMFVNDPSKKGVVRNAFYNGAVEYMLNKVKRLSRPLETFLFMLINAALMYKLRTSSGRSEIFWFFTPPRKSFAGVPCLHEGACWLDVIKGGAKFAGLAVLWQLGRFVLGKGLAVVREPKRLLKKLRSRSTVNFAISLGSYAFLYKAVHCLLCRRFGRELPMFAAVAGLVAGSAYAFEPRLDAFASGLVAAVTLILRRGDGKAHFPGIPVAELLMAFCCGVLFHARCMDAAKCPPLAFAMMDTATNHKAEDIYTTFIEKVHEAKAKECNGNVK